LPSWYYYPFVFVAEARTFDDPDLLTKQIRATSVKGESFDQVLGTLTSNYGIPIVIELGNEKLTPRREINLDLPETTVKEFLDSVIAKDPRYIWKLEGGVIHVRPLIGRDALLTNLLDTKISHFAFSGGTTRYRIFSDILDVPEIKTQLIVNDVAPFFIIIGSMQKVGNGISFAESNLTLRELLDRIIVKTEIKRWVITRWGENSEFITLKS
jgi:hypothetical protein